VVEGQYWPVSIELIVWRLTPAARASRSCEQWWRERGATRANVHRRQLRLWVSVVVVVRAVLVTLYLLTRTP